MTAVILEWLNALLRWAHIMTGIAWIGTSFFYIWMEAAIKKRAGQAPGIAGDVWMVHGGGFWVASKYAVAPDEIPEELHWFKWEAYFTLVTGLLLLMVIYYFGADAFLIDKDKVPLDPLWASLLSAFSLLAGWFIYDGICRSPIGQKTAPLAIAVFVEIAAFTFFYHGVFSDRAAFLHVGALIGTIMASSVFFVIIPNQKKAMAEMMAGRRPDPRYGKIAAQRSLHNNYLTLPVIFMMISNHYPIIFGHPWSPLIALGHRGRRRADPPFLQHHQSRRGDEGGDRLDPGGDGRRRDSDRDYRLPAGRHGGGRQRHVCRHPPDHREALHPVPLRDADQQGFSRGAEGRDVRHAR